MGHLLNDKPALVPLIGRLHRYPIGLVDSLRVLPLRAMESEAKARSPG